MPVISVLENLKQEDHKFDDHKFEDNLSYIVRHSHSPTLIIFTNMIYENWYVGKKSLSSQKLKNYILIFGI
jgi:hypothetical protein